MALVFDIGRRQGEMNSNIRMCLCELGTPKNF